MTIAPGKSDMSSDSDTPEETILNRGSSHYPSYNYNSNSNHSNTSNFREYETDGDYTTYALQQQQEQQYQQYQSCDTRVSPEQYFRSVSPVNLNLNLNLNYPDINSESSERQQWTLFWHDHVYKNLAPKPTPHYIENILGIQPSPPRLTTPPLPITVPLQLDSRSMSPRSNIEPRDNKDLKLGSIPLVRKTNSKQSVATNVITPTPQANPVTVPVGRLHPSTAVTDALNEPLNLSIKTEKKVPAKSTSTKGKNIFIIRCIISIL